jgi:hypothetical protein
MRLWKSVSEARRLAVGELASCSRGSPGCRTDSRCRSSHQQRRSSPGWLRPVRCRRRSCADASLGVAESFGGIVPAAPHVVHAESLAGDGEVSLRLDSLPVGRGARRRSPTRRGGCGGDAAGLGEADGAPRGTLARGCVPGRLSRIARLLNGVLLRVLPGPVTSFFAVGCIAGFRVRRWALKCVARTCSGTPGWSVGCLARFRGADRQAARILAFC